MNFLANNDVSAIAGYTAAGVTAVKSDIIDMAGYEEATFIFTFDTLINAGTLNCYINGNDANATGGMAKLAETELTYTVTTVDAAKGQNAIAISTFQPDPSKYRYLEAVVDPSDQNAVLTGVVCIRSGGKYKPEPQASLLACNITAFPAAA